jgi:hypothetical protein
MGLHFLTEKNIRGLYERYNGGGERATELEFMASLRLFVATFRE